MDRACSNRDGMRWVLGGRWKEMREGLGKLGDLGLCGRWWEAPPWPLALNAKQQCHCLASAAADACAWCFSGNQEQKLIALPTLHVQYTYMSHTAFEPLGIPGLHKHTCCNPQSENSHTRGTQVKVCSTPPYSKPQRCRESERSDHSGHSQELVLCTHKTA